MWFIYVILLDGILCYKTLDILLTLYRKPLQTFENNRKNMKCTAINEYFEDSKFWCTHNLYKLVSKLLTALAGNKIGCCLQRIIEFKMYDTTLLINSYYIWRELEQCDI